MWVKYLDYNPVKVPTKDCKDVDDLIKVCRKTLSPLLDSVSNAQLLLSTVEHTQALYSDSLLTDILRIHHNSFQNPVTIEETTTTASSFLGPTQSLQGPLWGVEEVPSERVDRFTKDILYLLRIPMLDYVQMEQQGVPLNPKSKSNLCMLLHNLEKVPVDALHQRFSAYQLWSLIATSGMGKTHAAFSYLSQHFGIYLSCAEPSLTNFGSEDMADLLKRLVIDGRISKNLNRNISHVDRFVRCILLARLIAFNQLKDKHLKARTMFSPLDWLLVQLFPPLLCINHYLDLPLKTGDYFMQMAAALQSLSDKDLTIRLEQELLQSKLSYLPVFLDEAQKLCYWKEDAFGLAKERPLYSAVCKALVSNRRTSVCAIGTSLAVRDTTTLNLSDSFKHLPSATLNYEVLRFQYSTAEAILGYLRSFIDVPEDLLFVCQWLVGRPRIAASFVECIYVYGFTETTCRLFVENRTRPQASDYSFYDKFEYLARLERPIKNYSRTLCDMKHAVESYLYQGEHFACTNAQVFELGFGILTETM
jgi:hypothetical protein